MIPTTILVGKSERMEGQPRKIRHSSTEQTAPVRRSGQLFPLAAQ
jgi:hypothetical protein